MTEKELKIAVWYLAFIFIITLVVFAIASFIMMDFNPNNWSIAFRGGVVAAWVVTFIIANMAFWFH